MKNTKNILRNIGFGIKVSYEASPFYFALKCIILLVNTLVPLISLGIWRNIINSIADSIFFDEIVIWVSIYLCLQMQACIYTFNSKCVCAYACVYVYGYEYAVCL